MKMSAVPPTPTPPLCMLAYPHTGRDGKENHGNGPFPLDDGLGDGLLAAIDGECMHILKITQNDHLLDESQQRSTRTHSESRNLQRFRNQELGSGPSLPSSP